MNRLVISCLIMISSFTYSDENRYPAEYSLLLNRNSELFEYAYPHPCGASVELRGVQLAYKLDMFDVDWVIEISDENKIINKWPTPLNSQPLAVSKNKLYLKIFNENNSVVSIFPDGNISPDSLERKADLTTGNCPEINENMNITKYFFCVKMQDLVTDKVRMFAVAPVCS